jgi:hypothetical protein
MPEASIDHRDAENRENRENLVFSAISVLSGVNQLFKDRV